GNSYAQTIKKGILIKSNKLFQEGKDMKYARYIILLVVFLVAGCVFAATQPPTGVQTQEPQAQWKAVIPQTLFADKLRMAAFLNENFGINGGAGDVGKARYTSDGGKTWTMADSSGG
ncbi:MAG TPA: hypothetical protein VJ373_08870, partial [Desulfatiglandales bacterium]|nr:hypothetical protein [Desulfatiglandales bacterium]